MNNNYNFLGQFFNKDSIVSEQQKDSLLESQKNHNQSESKVQILESNINENPLSRSKRYIKSYNFTIINGKIGQSLKKIGILNQVQINNILNIQKNDKKLFGNILLDKSIVSKPFLDNFIKTLSGNKEALSELKNKKIGELLVDLNCTDKDKLNECLKIQKNDKRKLGQIALEKGYILKSQLNKAVNIQKKTASLFIITLASTTVLASCASPRVGNFATLDNYAESNVVKSLNANPLGSVNYYQDGTVSISNLPFYQQGNNNTCGQAVMTSILNYWGVDITYQTVVNQTNSWNMFTDVDKITRYIRQKNVYAQDYRMASLSFLKDRIRKGLPVIVLLDFGTLATEHYVIVRGYNDEEKEFIILDPVDGPNIKIKYDAFEKMWENKSLEQMGLFGDKYKRIAFDIGG